MALDKINGVDITKILASCSSLDLITGNSSFKVFCPHRGIYLRGSEDPNRRIY